MKTGFKRIIISVLFVFLFALLVINLFRRINNGTNVSFNGFLDMLSRSNSFSITVNISDFTINGNWGLIDGLRQFFNVFAQIFGVLVWLGSNLINLILFLGQFLSYLFVA